MILFQKTRPTILYAGRSQFAASLRPKLFLSRSLGPPLQAPLDGSKRNPRANQPQIGKPGQRISLRRCKSLPTRKVARAPTQARQVRVPPIPNHQTTMYLVLVCINSLSLLTSDCNVYQGARQPPLPHLRLSNRPALIHASISINIKAVGSYS